MGNRTIMTSPNVRRNIDCTLGAILDRLEDSDIGDFKSIDEALEPELAAALQPARRRVRRAAR